MYTFVIIQNCDYSKFRSCQKEIALRDSLWKEVEMSTIFLNLDYPTDLDLDFVSDQRKVIIINFLAVACNIVQRSPSLLKQSFPRYKFARYRDYIRLSAK